MPRFAERSPDSWKAAHRRGRVADYLRYGPLSVEIKKSPSMRANAPRSGDSRSDIANQRLCAKHNTQARLLAKVYEVDPMVCPRCGGDMKVIAIIEDPRRTQEDSPASRTQGRAAAGCDQTGQHWAVTTWVRSRSAQVNVSTVAPRGTRVFFSRGKQTRNRSGFAVRRVCPLV